MIPHSKRRVIHVGRGLLVVRLQRDLAALSGFPLPDKVRVLLAFSYFSRIYSYRILGVETRSSNMLLSSVALVLAVIFSHSRSLTVGRRFELALEAKSNIIKKLKRREHN